MNQCPKCGVSHAENQSFCLSCGMYLKKNTASVSSSSPPPQKDGSFSFPPNSSLPIAEPTTAFQQTSPDNQMSRSLVAFAAIFIGYLGLHSLLMKKWVQAGLFLGVLLLSLATSRDYLLSITAMISIMQGIRILCLTDEEFAEIYLRAPKANPPSAPDEFSSPSQEI